MTVDGRQYDLKPFRNWLLRNYERLCSGHFIKAIKSGDKTKFTYDWQQIYFLADQYEFTKIYINEVNSAIAG